MRFLSFNRAQDKALKLLRLMPPAFLLMRFFFLLRNFFQPVRCIPQYPVHNSTADVLSFHVTLISECNHLVHEFERPVNVGIAGLHGNGFLFNERVVD